MTHTTENYILNPNHRVSIHLIGIGGTGSYLLTKLALLNTALISLGHIGIKVVAWDSDLVTISNLGRQLFHESDIGRNKAEVMIKRINWNFGYDWEFEPCKFEVDEDQFPRKANIIISCVDTVSARRGIHRILVKDRQYDSPQEKCYYWIDSGNTFRSGQVILGSFGKPKMKHFMDEFRKTKFPNDDDTPSCSVAESLSRQDLFINSFMADLVAQMLWTMFRYGKIDYRGIYVNLETMEINKISIDEKCKQF